MSRQPKEGEITPKETAQRLNVAYSTLTLWRDQGRGPNYVERGSYFFYREEDVESYLAEQERYVDLKKESPESEAQGDQSPASQGDEDDTAEAS